MLSPRAYNRQYQYPAQHPTTARLHRLISSRGNLNRELRALSPPASPLTSPPQTPGPSPRLLPISIPMTPITPLVLGEPRNKEVYDPREHGYFFHDHRNYDPHFTAYAQPYHAPCDLSPFSSGASTPTNSCLQSAYAVGSDMVTAYRPTTSIPSSPAENAVATEGWFCSMQMDDVTVAQPCEGNCYGTYDKAIVHRTSCDEAQMNEMINDMRNMGVS